MDIIRLQTSETNATERRARLPYARSAMNYVLLAIATAHRCPRSPPAGRVGRRRSPPGNGRLRLADPSRGRAGWRHQSCRRRNTSDALVPPKPNEFDSTTSISRSRARCGTKSTVALTEGLSRLSVGGATRSRIAKIEKMASTAPAAPSKWPIEDLVEDMEMQPASSPTSL